MIPGIYPVLRAPWRSAAPFRTRPTGVRLAEQVQRLGALPPLTAHLLTFALSVSHSLARSLCLSHTPSHHLYLSLSLSRSPDNRFALLLVLVPCEVLLNKICVSICMGSYVNIYTRVRTQLREVCE